MLVASGTATLEVALLKKPMVITYKMSPNSWRIMRNMGYQPWVGLPNILAQCFAVPEFLQDDATPKTSRKPWATPSPMPRFENG